MNVLLIHGTVICEYVVDGVIALVPVGLHLLGVDIQQGGVEELSAVPALDELQQGSTAVRTVGAVEGGDGTHR